MVSLLWLITIVLFVLWLLGFGVNIGAWIHVLLVAAVIMLLFNVISWAARGRSGGHGEPHHHV